MTTITTVRAALEAVAAEGWTPRSRFQLGSAMGPARLLVLSIATELGVSALRSSDATGRTWLHVFTRPDARSPRSGPADRAICYQEYSGAGILGQARSSGCGIVIDAGSPLECRIGPRDVDAMLVAASYTETLLAEQGRRVTGAA